MRKNIQYTAMILSLVLAASCNKVEGPVSGDDVIRFAPRSVETKALINDATGLQTQSFQVYDYMGTIEYINNTISYDATSGWSYGTEATYKWQDGTHKFFGYTSGTGSFADNKLSVAKTLTAADADQVDLLYSEIFSTTFANWKATKTSNDPVALNFKHLLSAVSFVVTNATTNPVVLHSVDVKIPNKGSATVDFSGDAPVVTYGSVSVDGDFITADAISDLSITQNQLIDVLTQAVTTETLYQMVWPQEFAEGSELTVSVSYTMTVPVDGDDTETEDLVFTKDVKIPAIAWEAGNKYDYVLKIYPADVRLIFNVMPWDEGEAGSINTSSGSINMTNVTWMNTKVVVDGTATDTVDDDAFSVTMFYRPTVNGEVYDGYFPAPGYFTVNYPMNGLFKIGLIPAYGETEVDESKYEIYIYDYPTTSTAGSFRPIDEDGEPISNKTVYFQVRAASAQDGAEYKAQIDVWFKPDGSDEWISAYSELRANYALVIPAVSTGSGD